MIGGKRQRRKKGKAGNIKREGRKKREREDKNSEIFVLISERKKKRHIFLAGEEKKRKWRAEIDGSICIDFLGGIHLYLWKNTHERKAKIEWEKKERGGDMKRERERKIFSLISVGGEQCLESLEKHGTTGGGAGGRL